MFYNSHLSFYSQTITLYNIKNLREAFYGTYLFDTTIINWNLYNVKDLNRAFTGASITNNCLNNIVAALLTATSIPATYKNLKTTNLSSPFYNFPRQINATTVGADLISQLQAKGWITD
jgi:hypothetical protein